MEVVQKKVVIDFLSFVVPLFPIINHLIMTLLSPPVQAVLELFQRKNMLLTVDANCGVGEVYQHIREGLHLPSLGLKK